MSTTKHQGFVLLGLGKLKRFPKIVIHMIIDYLDMYSATQFSMVNRQAQLLIWSITEYLILRYLTSKVYPKGGPKEPRAYLKKCTARSYYQEKQFPLRALLMGIPLKREPDTGILRGMLRYLLALIISLKLDRVHL